MSSTKSQSGAFDTFLRTLHGEDEVSSAASKVFQGVTPPLVIANKTQFILLDTLAAHSEGLRMADLEADTGLDSSSLMSAMLASVQVGFVTIDWPSGDLVRLTKRGREALDRFNE
jgi:hypothetical protein